MNGTSPVGAVGMVWSHPAVFGIRRLFYLVTPSETSCKKIGEVPEYVNAAVPYFTFLIILEYIILFVQNKRSPLPRGSDAFSSVAAGTMMLFPMLFMRNIEMVAYIWTSKHYTIVELPWDSPWTWWLAMLGTDLGYYWVHRFAHEVNFMWAAHQVHHSSEDYNLSTALRQSVLQRYTSWVFYLPMAFFIPPSVFMVHIQLNLIYQFYIHTEVVDKLGPLEWILNTPSHHRVHHGRNRYCIDRNYAGVLIIWDRMFGTFEAERPDDKVVYGLVHPLSSWDPIYTQFCHWKYIISKAWHQGGGWMNKAKVFVYGPGWEPGKPRLGSIEDIPDIHAPQPRYDQGVSTWLNIYVWVHFLGILAAQQLLIKHKSEYPMITVLVAMMYMIWSLSNVGYFYEQRWYAPLSELARCVVYLVVDYMVCASGPTCPMGSYIPRVMFWVSLAICVALVSQMVSIRQKKAL